MEVGGGIMGDRIDYGINLSIIPRIFQKGIPQETAISQGGLKMVIIEALFAPF